MAIDDGSSESRSSECSSLLTEEKTDFLALRETPFRCQTEQLKFLADSYNRTMNEEKNFTKVIFTGIAIKQFEMCLYNIIMCEISPVHTCYFLPLNNSVGFQLGYMYLYNINN